MRSTGLVSSIAVMLALLALPVLADDQPAAKKAEEASVKPAEPGRLSFMKDVAPILVENCIACHNPKKSESKFIMTTFAQLAKGGQQGEGMMLESGDPDASYFVELIRPDGEPRMPYKQDPLPPEKIKIIERWVKEGAKYDGADPSEDWTAALHKLVPVVVPENYPVPVAITALAFSPDGSEIAASGYHEVTLWKSADGTLSRRLRPLAERIYDIAYSADGKWMATASGDPGQYGSVKLWLAESAGGGKAVRDLAEGSDCFFAVAFSPDSKLIASAGADRTIRIWEVESGKALAAIEDHADWIFDLAFSPDGKRLASASRDKTSKVFDVEKKESIVTFPGHGETVYSVAFGPDGKFIATGGGDNQIRYWNPDDDGKQIRNIGGFGGPVFRIQFTSDGKSLIACSADKNLRILNAKDGGSQRTLSGHTDWIYSFALSPDGKTIASGSWDGEVRLWNLDDGKPGLVFVAAPGLKSKAPEQAAK